MKANSPPGPSSSAVSMVAGQGTRNRRNSTTSTPDLMTISPTSAEEDRRRVATQVGDVEAHADGEEEHAEQEPLERLDGRLDGAVILGLGQQQPATKAPSAIDRPAAAVTSPLPTATNSAAATNSSVEFGRGDEAEQRPQQRLADERDQRR